MSKIFQNLWQVKGNVLLIILLLIVQVYCDLALPAYTSDIVDVGIQQGGIDHVAASKFSAQTFERLCLMLEENDEQLMRASYEVDKEGNYVIQNPEKEDLALLDEVLGMPMLLLDSMQDMTVGQMMEQGYADEMTIEKAVTVPPLADEMTGQESFMDSMEEAGSEEPATEEPHMEQPAMGKNGQNSAIMEEIKSESIWDLIDMGMMTKEQLLQMKAVAEEGFVASTGDLSDSIINQKAVLFVKAEYERLGMDTGKIQMDYLLKMGGIMLLYAISGMICALIVGFLAAKSGAQIGKTLREKVFKKVVSFSSNEMNSFSTASLITRSTNDIQQVQMVSTMLLRMVLYAPIMGIGGIIKVMNTNTGLEWIIVVAVVLICAFVLLLVSIAMPKFKVMQTLVDGLNLVSREILTGIPVIRAFSREKHEEERFADANAKLMKTQLFTNRVMTFMMPVMTIIMNAISVGIIWFGSKGVDLGNLQVGDMMAFITYTMMIVMSFLMLTMMSIMLPRAGIAAGRIDEIIQSKSSIFDAGNPVSMSKDTCRGEVAFENVSFRYEGASDDAIANISFTAQPGQTTAIIGSTGSGKSTIIHLMDRFYDVTEGRITVDGVDIRQMTQHDLHSLVGLVPQKGILFTGTIGSNIKFDAEHITDEAMREAAEIAQATEFISEKTKQFDSEIAQGGSNVSGGQKQRLSIARVIAKNPKIYLFDDSFSALDYKTDAMLRKALAKKTKDATVIIVAQRISTIMHADKIIVLDDGKVAGIGTHRELLETCETYQEIASSQLSEAELKGGIA